MPKLLKQRETTVDLKEQEIRVLRQELRSLKHGMTPSFSVDQIILIHKVLDGLGVPKEDKHGDLTAYGRIALIKTAET